MTPTVGQMSTDTAELGRVEDEQDPHTTATISAFDLPADAVCLELGAGSGSITMWLAQRFGAANITAVDHDVSQLGDAAAAGVNVVEADLGTFRAQPGGFDLVHARAVLTHLANRAELLRSAVSWLRPGGYLLVADPADFPVASSPYRSMRRVAAALTDLATGMGTDTAWARRYPAQLIEAGLEDVNAESRLRMMRGGTREALMMLDLFRKAEKPLMASGAAREDVTEVLRLLESPDYVDLPPAVIRAWGRKPRTEQ